MFTRVPHMVYSLVNQIIKQFKMWQCITSKQSYVNDFLQDLCTTVSQFLKHDDKFPPENLYNKPAV